MHAGGARGGLIRRAHPVASLPGIAARNAAPARQAQAGAQNRQRDPFDSGSARHLGSALLSAARRLSRFDDLGVKQQLPSSRAARRELPCACVGAAGWCGLSLAHRGS
jgi:hypothetical protein